MLSKKLLEKNTTLSSKKTTSISNRQLKYGVKCRSCKDRIFSWHRHDFRTCSCHKTFIDGGNDYIRMGYPVDSKPPQRVIFNEKRDKYE